MKSIEIRWFFKDPATKEKILRPWIEKIGELVKEDKRTDFYLPTTFNSSLGLKIRKYGDKTNIEAKEKLKSLGYSTVDSNDIGNIELWNKWSFELKEQKTEESKDLQVLFQILNEETSWVKIEKTRSLCKFSIGSDLKLTPIKEEKGKEKKLNDNGCLFELTDVICNGKLWLTFGCEAFNIDDDDGKIFGNLKSAVKEKLSGDILSILKPEDSYSYAGFIDKNIN